jgi:predicted Fe-Mo cluster-binding NifX family protein
LKRGTKIMKIAVTYENGEIFQHFGHTQNFKIYEAEDGKIISSEVVSTNGSGHGALATMLKDLGVEVLICGGIGGGARMALFASYIELFGGVSGDADRAVEAYLAGNLSYDPDAKCDHHDHHHGEGHNCGEHDCGSHNCGEHGCH